MMDNVYVSFTDDNEENPPKRTRYRGGRKTRRHTKKLIKSRR
jgi:hypothetical protein